MLFVAGPPPCGKVFDAQQTKVQFTLSWTNLTVYLIQLVVCGHTGAFGELWWVLFQCKTAALEWYHAEQIGNKLVGQFSTIRVTIIVHTYL
jgi:hypothetical protein